MAHNRRFSIVRLTRCIVPILIVAFARLIFAADDSPPIFTIVTGSSIGPVAGHGLDAVYSALRQQGWTFRSAAVSHGPDIQLFIEAGTSVGDFPDSSSVRSADLTIPHAPESAVVKKISSGARSVLFLAGADDRGLMYAALDTAARVRWATNSADPLSEVRDLTETPSTRDRAVSMYTMNRAYWESRFYDDAYWTNYFDMLAADRFNKVRIVFGYENGGFLAPCYPYFFNTPGFPDVHMNGLTPEQQKKNFAALNHLIDVAHSRGIAVAIGIWDHIYRGGVQAGGAEWIKDYPADQIPNTVVGVTTENLNAYTLASLKEFFAAFPKIDEIQFRIHEESGLKRDEMDGFWRQVFQMAKATRPDLLFEARGKGTPDSVIDTALDLGIHLRVETKFWMEQMGLPFHPTHINTQDQQNRRHGYADFLRYPKRYDMNWTLWNGGTARVLLWADPNYMRRFISAIQLYDSPNWDVNEPLATKMEAQRPDMKPFDLMPAQYRYYHYEFERYWQFYLLWGRLGYNTNADPEIWHHEFTRRFGPAAPHVEAGLFRASQVLPYIVASSVYPYSAFPTTRGWAERQSLGKTLAQYAKNTGTDIAQFESFPEAAQRIATNGVTSRRTPDDVSEWLDTTANDVLSEVTEAEKSIGTNRGNEFDATMTDLRILANLAQYHAYRARAAVEYDLYQIKGKSEQGANAELDNAIILDRKAIAAWRNIVTVAGDRYNSDLAMGTRTADLCGSWRDELPPMEADLARLEKLSHSPLANETNVTAILRSEADRLPGIVQADRIHSAKPLTPLRITAKVANVAGVANSLRLRYRHLTQYENYASLDMQPTSEPNVYAATIPADFIIPKWDLIYYIECPATGNSGSQWPDLATEAPYIIVHLQR